MAVVTLGLSSCPPSELLLFVIKLGPDPAPSRGGSRGGIQGPRCPTPKPPRNFDVTPELVTPELRATGIKCSSFFLLFLIFLKKIALPPFEIQSWIHPSSPSGLCLQSDRLFQPGVTGPDNDQDQTTTTLFGRSLVLKFHRTRQQPPRTGQ